MKYDDNRKECIFFSKNQLFLLKYFGFSRSTMTGSSSFDFSSMTSGSGLTVDEASGLDEASELDEVSEPEVAF
jgi:hypothetical protein